MTSLEALRVIGGLTQTELADEIGIRQSWLSKIERLKVAPGANVARKLEARFGVPIDVLLGPPSEVLAVRA